MGVWGLRVWGLGFRGLGFRVWGFRGLGFNIPVQSLLATPKGPKYLYGTKYGFCSSNFPHGLGKYSPLATTPDMPLV